MDAVSVLSSGIASGFSVSFGFAHIVVMSIFAALYEVVHLYVK